MKRRLVLNQVELARIKKRIRLDEDTGCWLWQGPTTPNGYGKWMVRPGESERVIHRVMWEHANRTPVPAGRQLDHLCRNRTCCNPRHLEPVTPSENTDRQDHANRRKDRCPKGHPYDATNTRLRSDGRRACRACDAERVRTPNPAGTTPPAVASSPVPSQPSP